jgi:Right handed beta helix region
VRRVICNTGQSLRLVMASVVLLVLAGALAAGSANAKRASIVRSTGDYVGAWRSGLSHPREPSCTVYVSPGGRSRFAGRRVGAPTTLLAATRRVVPGSVVCLEAGTYDTSSNIILSRSGRWSAPVYYRNYGGTALLRYTGGSLSGGVLQTASGAHWGGAHHIVIDGLTIDGGDLIGGGIFVTYGSHNITIRNCVILNTGATGIAVNASDRVTVDHNLIYHAGYNQGDSSGISLWYGGTTPVYGGRTAWHDRYPGFHNFIADNIVSGSYDNSINHSEGNGIVVDGMGSIPPALVINNLVYENGGRGISVYHNAGDIWVVNNTAYADGLDLKVGGGQAPEFLATSASNVHFVNDLAYGRQITGGYSTAYTYNNTSSTISWVTSIGYNGSTMGLSASVRRDPRRYRYANPGFTSTPPVPATETPWTGATPPWSIGDAFALLPGSQALHAGVDPITVRGITRALASGLRAFVRTEQAGRRTHAR